MSLDLIPAEQAATIFKEASHGGPTTQYHQQEQQQRKTIKLENRDPLGDELAQKRQSKSQNNVENEELINTDNNENGKVTNKNRNRKEV